MDLLTRYLKSRVWQLVFILDVSNLNFCFNIIKKLPKGTIVILRAYLAPFRSNIAFEVSAVCRRLGLVFLVGGDPLLAKKCKSCGIHLSEENFSRLRKWKFLEKKWIVTAASHSLKKNFKIFVSGLDAAIYSPVFKTKTHKDAKPLGHKKFALDLIALPKVTIYAMGGISKQNFRLLQNTKVHGIAGIHLYNNIMYS